MCVAAVRARLCISGVYNGSWNNTGDKVILRCADGSLKDTCSYPGEGRFQVLLLSAIPQHRHFGNDHEWPERHTSGMVSRSIGFSASALLGWRQLGRPFSPRVCERSDLGFP